MVTDHKLLITILGSKKGMLSIAAARLQPWAIQLAAYQYDINFKPTKDHAGTEALS